MTIQLSEDEAKTLIQFCDIVLKDEKRGGVLALAAVNIFVAKITKANEEEKLPPPPTT